MAKSEGKGAGGPAREGRSGTSRCFRLLDHQGDVLPVFLFPPQVAECPNPDGDNHNRQISAAAPVAPSGGSDSPSKTYAAQRKTRSEKGSFVPFIPGELDGGDPICRDILKSTRQRIGVAGLLDVYPQETGLNLLDPALQAVAVQEEGIDSFAAEQIAQQLGLRSPDGQDLILGSLRAARR